MASKSRKDSFTCAICVSDQACDGSCGSGGGRHSAALTLSGSIHGSQDLRCFVEGESVACQLCVCVCVVQLRRAIVSIAIWDGERDRFQNR